MSDEFRQTDLMIGDVPQRRWTTEGKLQIMEEGYAGDRCLRGSAAWSRAKSSVW